MSGGDTHWMPGAAEGTRTPDPIITNDVLYQLSYSGTVSVPDLVLTGGAASFKPSVLVLQAKILMFQILRLTPKSGARSFAQIPKSLCAISGRFRL